MADVTHPKKEVKYVLKDARDSGFIIEELHRGHRWGRIRCPICGPIAPVHCTPKNEGNHARFLRKKVEQCLKKHGRPDQQETEEA